MTKKSLLEEAFLDATVVKKTALEQAKNAIAESLSPTLNSIFAQKIQEMEDEELNEEEDLDLEEITEDDEELEDSEEIEGEETEDGESEEEFDIENMTAEELEEFIETTVADMLSTGELGSGEESEEDLDLSDDEAMQDDLTGDEELDMDFEDDSAAEEDEEVDINELMLEIKKEQLAKSRAARQIPNKSKSNIVYESKINSLQKQLNETKLYNAKLLYANKLIVNKDLTVSQKVKVLETLDKAKTANEAKLIFESLNTTLSNQTKKQVVRRPASDVMSNITESVQNKGIISADPTVLRMQKLAGIIK